MNLADGAHHSVDFANLFVHCPDAVVVFDIHLHITAGFANADDFVST
jgi:hypothetical protein